MGMLALERRVNEQIIIDTTGIKPGELIKIMVIRVGARDGTEQSVKLGVDAPRECTVDREEVYNARQREKRLMATGRKS